MSGKRRIAISLVLALAGTLTSLGAAQGSTFTVNFFNQDGSQIIDNVTVSVAATAAPGTPLTLSPVSPFKSGTSFNIVGTPLAGYADKSVIITFTHGGTTTIMGLLGNSSKTQVLNVAIPAQ